MLPDMVRSASEKSTKILCRREKTRGGLYIVRTDNLLRERALFELTKVI